MRPSIMKYGMTASLSIVWFAGVITQAASAEPNRGSQIEELNAIKKRIVNFYTLEDLPPEPALRFRTECLDREVDHKLAIEGGFWSKYVDVKDPGISYAGWAWQEPSLLATAYARPTSRHYHSRTVLEAVEAALKHLMQFAYPGCPQPGNWWAWQIGTPIHLLATLTLLEKDLDRELFQKEVETVTYLLKMKEDVRLEGAWTPPDKPYLGVTDTNKLWHERLCLHLAVLIGNPAMAGKWSDRAMGEIAPAGVGQRQADGSFKFHGEIPMWAYGRSFLVDYAWLIDQYGGTTFGPDSEQLDRFADFAARYVNGFMYRGTLCPAMIGRELTRGNEEYRVRFGPAGVQALAALARSGHPRAKEFAAMARRELSFLQADETLSEDCRVFTSCTRDYSELIGLTQRASHGLPPVDAAPPGRDVFAYPDSDFMQVTRPEWAVGIKMHSKRNRGYESINGENLRGWFLSHGSMFLMQSGREWTACWPTIDWTRLPGTTVAVDAKNPNLSRYAGVIRISPELAMAAMELQVGDFGARKSWLVDGERIVCVGSGIRGKGRVETTVINQPGPARAELIVDGETVPAEAFERNVSATWLWHRNVGYVFPAGQELHVVRESRTSNWSSVRDEVRHGKTEPVTSHYVTAVISHNNENDGYAYVMLPSVSRELMPELAKQVKERYAIESVGPHRVTIRDLSAEAVVLWTGGQAGPVQADRGCMALRSGESWQMTDPTWDERELRLTIDGHEVSVKPRRGRAVVVDKTSAPVTQNVQ